MVKPPRIALTVGDPAGIGPEIVRAVLTDRAVTRRAQLFVIGPASERPAAVPLAASRAASRDARAEAGAHWLVSDAPGDALDWQVGQPQASAGRAALAALRLGAELAQAGEVDVLVTAPVSKEALHAAGERCEGQSELLGRWAGSEVEMLAIAGRMRVLLLTRHMPLRQALDAISAERVRSHLHVLHDGLEALGIEHPRLALAGLNPHAGEAGILGREEIDQLQPAVAAARSEGLDVTGPEPPDTVFVRASRGEFDGVLALYHDQAFIPVKLAAPTTGLTVLLGLPYLRVSPAHGTAFDIAGKGIADPSNLACAIVQAADWVEARQSPPVAPGPSSSPAASRT